MVNKNLLPPGFRDDLSPLVEQEHSYLNKIISIFNSNGYHMVKPPLIEFVQHHEAHDNYFVIFNEDESKKLRIRNDITMQVARIANSRLNHLERPLRLCYYGEVVRNKGTMLRPERQFLQVGAECIGEKNNLADVEILMLAFESLQSVGIKSLLVDFSTPVFLNKIINSNLTKGKKNNFIKYFQRKDLSRVLSMIKDKTQIDFIKNLIKCRGNIKNNINLLKNLKIDDQTSLEIDNILSIYNLIKNKLDDIVINIDFTDYKDHDYYTGINFTVFAKNVRGEIANGGRYLTKSLNGENAVGFTCYMDTIIRASSNNLKEKRILIPFNTKKEKIRELLKKGFVIERNLRSSQKLNKNYKINCSHVLENNKIKKINND